MRSPAYAVASFLLLLRFVVVAGAGAFEFGPHPRLEAPVVDSATVVRARALLAEQLEVPEESGDWIFYYACQTHNATLTKKPEGHTCPVCGTVYNDERTHRAWLTARHSHIDNACLTLAQAWHLTREDVFAREVWRLLCRYAELTPGWGRHDRWGRRGFLAVIGGKRYAQSLDDACGIILQARAYDLIYAWPGITQEARRTVERDLFRVTADSIYRMYLLYDGKNNHMTWFNAAVATVGTVLGDTAYLTRALDGSKGFRWQMTHSVTAEGLWYEGTLAYHFYALQAVMVTLEAAQAAQADVTAEQEQTRRMFLAPLTLAYPDGTLPAINDSDPASLDGYRRAYRQAAAQFDDPALQAFAAGEPVPQRPSEVMSDAGLAYLRLWREDPVMAILDFGQHGGHHGHPDKLNVLFFAGGKELFPDIGRLSYSCAEYETWARQTVAHNTVVLGRRSQRPDNGTVLASGRSGAADYVVGESRGAYDGAVLRRALVLLPDGSLVDLFRVEQRGRGQIADWVLHGTVPLTLAGAGPLQEVPGALAPSDGYQHVAVEGSFAMTETVRVVWQTAATRTVTTWLLQDGTTPETLYRGSGIGYALTQRFPLVIRSRPPTPLTVFAAVHVPGDGAGWRVGQEDGSVVVAAGTRRVIWDGAAGVVVEQAD